MKRAGLPLSVGQASITMRVLLAIVFAAAAALCVGGGMLISSNAAARVIAIVTAMSFWAIAFLLTSIR